MERDWSLIEYFKRDEFPKNPDLVAWPLVLLMDEIRAASGIPLYIHVAWDDGGHASKSKHYTGEAVDFHFGPGMTHQQEFELLCSFSAIGGLGFYPEWRPRAGWHVDIRRVEQRVCWFRLNKEYHYGLDQLSRAVSLTL